MRLIDRLRILVLEDVEIVVVDDSKVPLPESCLGEWEEKLTYLHRGEKLGVSSARNIGSQHSKGEYLIFLDDDDAVTECWMDDFYSNLMNHHDLVYCNMRLIAPSGKVSSVSASKNNRGIVIPGAWMIRKEVFDQVGGYDERLKFAENTELFFRLDKLHLNKHYIEKENFIYHQSYDGGSKNLQNMLESIRIILEKHDQILTDHVKHLYHQNIGVIEMRFGRFGLAKKHLWKSWRFKPQKISTPIRIALAYFPFLAKRFYTLEIPKR
ncbi:GT2 family glycosyltransferase [Algoriphagus boseongensis]|uniref:GT2 family glycosyltransferase n=2 Tax=Algoriphagus boseongensis TaxID=1442587 RepID=A0A4R6TDR3_9BACT|nr:GT2 family glycosyltransferase [Algoriphagus boseongensis]